MPKCHRCGKMVKEGDDQCGACGTKVKDWEFVKDRKNRLRMGKVFAMLGFLACLAAIWAFIYLSNFPSVPTYAVYIISIAILAGGVLLLVRGNHINSEGDS